MSIRVGAFFRKMRRQWQLYLMVLLPVVYIVVFAYVPMGGIVIAFKDYSLRKGIWGSPWVGMKYFEQFVSTPLFFQLIRNTVLVSVYGLVVSFFMPIILALALNEVRSVALKKTVQMFTFFPYFISTVVMVGIILQVLNLNGGLFNNIVRLFGGEALNYMGVPQWWRSIYVWSGVWQTTGYSAIIYIAALSGIDPQQIEASIIDGANRLQRMWYIDLSAIRPTVTILLIMAVGNIMSVGFEKVYLMQNTLNLDVSEIISTYVYKRGMDNAQYSYATAVGLFNSLVNFVLLITTNMISRRVGETSLW